MLAFLLVSKLFNPRVPRLFSDIRRFLLLWAQGAICHLCHERLAVLYLQPCNNCNTNTQIQMHKYEYTNTNTQIQIHKYEHTKIRIHKYTNTQIQIQIHKYTHTIVWQDMPPMPWGTHHPVFADEQQPHACSFTLFQSKKRFYNLSSALSQSNTLHDNGWPA